MQLSGSRQIFLEAVAQETRTSFGGWVRKDDVRETLGLTHGEADTLAATLVELGLLHTQGFGNLDIKVSAAGHSSLNTSPT